MHGIGRELAGLPIIHCFLLLSGTVWSQRLRRSSFWDDAWRSWAAWFTLLPYVEFSFSPIPVCCCTLSTSWQLPEGVKEITAPVFAAGIVAKCVSPPLLVNYFCCRHSNHFAKLNMPKQSWGRWDEFALQRVQVLFLLFQLASEVELLCHVFCRLQEHCALGLRALSRSHLLLRVLKEVDINTWKVTQIF